jgi:hypothetical protein
MGGYWWRNWYFEVILFPLVSDEFAGHNIEVMDEYFPISCFDAVYIIDLSVSVLEAARERIARNGWTNVTILCQDAHYFQLPEWQNGMQLEGSVSLATLSYTLSMVGDQLWAPHAGWALTLARWMVFIVWWTAFTGRFAHRTVLSASSTFTRMGNSILARIKQGRALSEN